MRSQSTRTLVLAALPALILAGCAQPEAENDQADPGEQVQTPAAHSHADPNETCFICDPAKRDPDRLWCNEHGRYEDRCFLCHPEIRDEERLYCEEHYLYEDECFLCHPELKDDTAEATPIVDPADTQTRAAVSDTPDGLYCKTHDVMESECGICHPELLASRNVGEGLKIRFPSNESARKAGVTIGAAQQSEFNVGVHALGEVTYNRNKLAIVTPYAKGVVNAIHVDVGDEVSEGDLLAVVHSPAIADAKNAYVKALVDAELHRQQFARERELLERNVTTKQEYDQAQAAYAASTSEIDRARQQLLNLGLTPEEVDQVKSTRSTSSALPLRAPFDGVVVEREAVPGTSVEPGAPLFHVADLSTMWLDLSVPDTEAVHVAKGAEVQAEIDALPGETFEGEVVWIAPHVDHPTRTVEVRAAIENPDRRLKNGLFGNAVIADAIAVKGLTVPEDAVQTIDGRPVVFTKLEDDLYETRLVKTGVTLNGRIEIMQGLSPDEPIAVSQGYILKSELLKARLGAGCVDH